MAIDIGIQELNSAWRVTDVYGTLLRMRRQRGGSIQTPVQYYFVHQVGGGGEWRHAETGAQCN